MWYNEISKLVVNNIMLLKTRVGRIKNDKNDEYIYLSSFTILTWFNKIGFRNT